MKSTIISLLSVIILNSILIFNICAQTRSVIFEIRDQDQNQVDGAELRLRHVSPTLDSEFNATFRQAGLYEVQIPEHLIDNQFELIVDGRNVNTFRRTIYWSGETRFTISVETIPVSLFEMIVRDENNRPIGNARVTISADEIGTLAVRHVRNGEYRVDLPNSLINRQLNLEIAADGFETLRRSVRWQGDERISLNLIGVIKSLPFHIALSDQYDQPITEARLIIRYEDREFIPASEVGGRYNFELRDDMVDQFIRIEVNADGYESLRESIHWTGTDRITRILEREPPPSIPAPLITISLRNRENVPVHQARVIVRPSEYAAYTALHQSNGMYESRIPDIREGMELAVEVEADNYENRSHRFIWRGAGHVEEITVSEIWRFALEVQVLDDVENQPVENAQVRLLARQNGRTDAIDAVTRGGGRYSFELPPGREYDRYTVAIAAQDYETVQREYEPGMGESVTYYLRGIDITRVSDRRFGFSVIPIAGYGRSHVDIGTINVNGLSFTVGDQAGFVHTGLQILYGHRFQIGTEFTYLLIPMKYIWTDETNMLSDITLEINQMSLNAITKYHIYTGQFRLHLKAGIGFYMGDISLSMTDSDDEQNNNLNSTIELKDDIGFHAGIGFSYPLGKRIWAIAEANYSFIDREVDNRIGNPEENTLRLNNIVGQIGITIRL